MDAFSHGNPSCDGGDFAATSSYEADHDEGFDHYLRSQNYSFTKCINGNGTSSLDPPSPIIFQQANGDGEETCHFRDEDDFGNYLTPICEHCQDIDMHDICDCTGAGPYSCKSADSTPLESPFNDFSTNKLDLHPCNDHLEFPSAHSGVQMFQEVELRSPYLDDEGETTGGDDGANSQIVNSNTSDHISIYHSQGENKNPKVMLDFENNSIFWLPPPPEDEEDEVENSPNIVVESDDDDIGAHQEDDDDDDDNELSACNIGGDITIARDRLSEFQREPLREVIRGHFRALVSQLLKAENINDVQGDGTKDCWLEIVSSLAWQAAKFVKPDTSGGGSMDPVDYVKVKCIACGLPNQSVLVKGVVCTKNIKHKRMTSQFRNPRLLLLGGALEYQRLRNQLSSIGTLLDQEMDHIKMSVSKIEAHRPNVLLVEKSVSSYAQEYLLAKEISLVLNVKRPLLERIARCTGAQIVPCIDSLLAPRLGQCEVFRVEKVVEDCQSSDSSNKKSLKTLMYFEGCPRRLGCTVLLRGAPLEELKKAKHVMQYAVFAAYHLSLETSFLADEGASLPKLALEPQLAPSQKPSHFCEARPLSHCKLAEDSQCFNYVEPSLSSSTNQKMPKQSDRGSHSGLENDREQLLRGHADPSNLLCLSSMLWGPSITRDINIVASPEAQDALLVSPNSHLQSDREGLKVFSMSLSPCSAHAAVTEVGEQFFMDGVLGPQGNHHGASGGTNALDVKEPDKFVSAVDTHQSILVLVSNQCVLKGTIYNGSQLLRIKFYGSFDKPLGRFLQDDLFDQVSHCRSCDMPPEAHVRCYIHQQGSLTICVRHLPSLSLPGQHEGKIWMWHRCVKCALKNGVSHATKRVVMSDAAWGLSFGKFLELSFSNHATANRVASCGHSLQRDCLRYYGCGNMVAFFRYAPINILAVFLPPSLLEYKSQVQQEWLRREAADVSEKIKFLYGEVLDVLQKMGSKVASLEHDFETLKLDDFQSYMVELKDMLEVEKSEYDSLLQSATLDSCHQAVPNMGNFEFSYLRQCLLVDSYLWDRRLCMLDSLLRTKRSAKFDLGSFQDRRIQRVSSLAGGGTSPGTDIRASLYDGNNLELHTFLKKYTKSAEVNLPDDMSDLKLYSENLVILDSLGSAVECYGNVQDAQATPDDLLAASEVSVHSPNLSDKIDMAWTGTVESAPNNHIRLGEPAGFGSALTTNRSLNNPDRNMAPVRVYSLDSVLRFHERIQNGFLHATPHLSMVKSFHAIRDYGSLVREPIPNMRRLHYKDTIAKSDRFDFMLTYKAVFISSLNQMVCDGPRLLLPSTGEADIVVPVYDNEPTSIIAYSLSCNEYRAFVSNAQINVEVSKPMEKKLALDGNMAYDSEHVDHVRLNYHLNSEVQFRSYGSDDTSARGSPTRGSSKSLHFKMLFTDDSSLPTGNVKFTVTCFFAKQFDALRRKCSPNELDFIHSVSRCRRWSAEGGKSNVYFAKTLDERFIVKQVTKTELESFEDFAPDYFRYLSDSLDSGSPTCLAKVLGIYQVSIKYLKSGKEVKMDLLVMENLFFGRTISQVYDLKGSARSRYIHDTSGKNKVLLDENLLEVLRTKPIFLGSKAKRILERAVWNDTSFLASVDVMDYSLLVGVDEGRKELVLGIIDFIRQYTWDKHLETWVKRTASILTGPKSASPTVISPQLYKKRFRKAMSSYFLVVPEQWSS